MLCEMWHLTAKCNTRRFASSFCEFIFYVVDNGTGNLTGCLNVEAEGQAQVEDKVAERIGEIVIHHFGNALLWNAQKRCCFWVHLKAIKRLELQLRIRKNESFLQNKSPFFSFKINGGVRIELRITVKVISNFSESQRRFLFFSFAQNFVEYAVVCFQSQSKNVLVHRFRSFLFFCNRAWA